MTHESAANQDEWDTLPDATTIEPQPLPGVPIGDLDPDVEFEAMLAHDGKAGR